MANNNSIIVYRPLMGVPVSPSPDASTTFAAANGSRGLARREAGLVPDAFSSGGRQLTFT